MADDKIRGTIGAGLVLENDAMTALTPGHFGPFNAWWLILLNNDAWLGNAVSDLRRRLTNVEQRLAQLEAGGSTGGSSPSYRFGTPTQASAGSTPSPVLSVDFTATSGATTGRVDFTANASSTGGSIVDYSWQWGDGTTGSGSTTWHAYASTQTYTVTLTVRDAQGTTRSVSKAVTPPAAQQQPSEVTASIKTTINGNPGQVDFDAVASSSGGLITSFVWDFGDASATAGSQSVTHTYTTSGTYTVKLTVRDSTGASTTVTKSVTPDFGDQADPQPTPTAPTQTSVSTASRRVIWQRGGMNSEGERYPEYDAPAGTDNTKVGTVRESDGLRAQRVHVAIPAASIPAAGSATKLYATFSGAAGAVAWLGADSSTPDSAVQIGNGTDITAIARTYPTVYVGRFGVSSETVESFTLTLYTQ